MVKKTETEELDEMLLTVMPYEPLDDSVSVVARAMEHIRNIHSELELSCTRLESAEKRIAEILVERDLYDARRRAAMKTIEQWRERCHRLEETLRSRQKENQQNES